MPEAFDSRSILPIAHVTAQKIMQSLGKLYRFSSAQIQTASEPERSHPLLELPQPFLKQTQMLIRRILE